MHYRFLSLCVSLLSFATLAFPAPAHSQEFPNGPVAMAQAHSDRCADNSICRAHRQQADALKRTIVVLKDPSVAELLENHPARKATKGLTTLSVEALASGQLHANKLKQAHATAIQTLSKHKISVRASYSIVMNALVVDKQLTFDEASKLLPNQILSVFPNEEISASLDKSVPIVKAPDVWQLIDSTGQKITGRGVRIGIIDTGIDYTHPDLGGCARTGNINNGSCAKVAGGYDFINRDNDPFDDNGHGTHCAATAAGNGTLSGVAPDALLYAYKVLSGDGYGFTQTVVAGIERAADPNQDGNVNDHLDVISLSLGGPGGPNDAGSLALDRAMSLGMVAVVAAGNSGNASGTIGSPGTSRDAITVGARTKEGQMAHFSSRGPVKYTESKKTFTLTKPDVNAPGVYICAAASSGAAPLGPTCLDSRHMSISGTSMATPHVAGLAALVKQAHPNWSAYEIKSSIKRSASHASMESYSALNDEGTGTVDALAAVQSPRGEAFIRESHLTATTLDLSIRVPVGQKYTISVANIPTLEGSETATWTTLASSISTAILSEVGISTLNLRQGAYFARLGVTTPSGATIFDYTQFTIDRFALTSPQEGDVVNAIDPVLVELTNIFNGPVDSMAIEYSLNGGAYTSQGTSVSPQSLSGAIALPPIASTGSLAVRARVVTRGLEEVFNVDSITVEPRVSEGFPIRVPRECGRSWWGTYLCQPNWVAHPVVADIDGDNSNEILVWRNRAWPYANEMQIYNGSGSLVRSFPLSAHPLQEYYSHQQYSPRPPIVTDLEGDGIKEVVIVESYVPTVNGIKEPTIIAAYSKDGKVKAGFPLITSGPNDSLVVADLNRDGRKEIIVKNFSRTPGFGQTISVIEPDGTIVGDVQLKIDGALQTVSAADEGRDSVVGNFDDDSDLEVAVFTGGYDPADLPFVSFKTALYVIDWDQRGPVEAYVPPIDGMSFGTGAVFDSDSDGRHELTIPTTASLEYSQSLNYLIPSVKPTTVRTSKFPIVDNLCPFINPTRCGRYGTGTAIARLKGQGTRSVVGFAESWNPGGTQLHLLSGESVQVGIGALFAGKSASSPPTIRDITGDGENDIVISNDYYFIPAQSRGLFVVTSESNYTESFRLATEKNWDFNTGFSPTVADIDNDGLLEVTYATLGDSVESRPPNSASKQRFSIYSFDTNGQASRSDGAWTMWRGNDDHNGCIDCDGPIVPSVEQAPVITEQPRSITVIAGQSFSLRVSATGESLTYQWERADGKIGSESFQGWFPIPGATGTALTNTITNPGTFLYRVRVTGKTRQSISEPATITVPLDPSSRVCPIGSPKLFWGACGCRVEDIDTDSDGTIDCVERRPYRSLGAPTITKLVGTPPRYKVVLPDAPSAKGYTITATYTPSRGSPRSVVKSSRGRTFILSGLRRGTWEVAWTADIIGVPSLSTAKGKSATLVVR